MTMHEPLKGLFTSSTLLILDFEQIPTSISDYANIRAYFSNCEAKGINPRLPENRQRFNDQMLKRANVSYLIGRYTEDRSSMLAGSRIAHEGRTFHLGIDIFCTELEKVYAPCDGEIIEVGYETLDAGYGHYIVLKPADDSLPYLFFGHLGPGASTGSVKVGERIARLGDYKDNENGGWSRHLHLQMLRQLPPVGETPIGYSTKVGLQQNIDQFPNPLDYFLDWRIV